MEIFSRTIGLIGQENFDKIKNKNVLILGLGGVGGSAFETLVRSGVSSFTLVDNDTFSYSNLNRQVLSSLDSVGKDKVQVAKTFAESINRDIKVTTIKKLFLGENASDIDFKKFDYVIDAIDNVTAKIFLAENLEKLGVPLISAMGTANKMNPSELEVADIYSTSVCPLCKVMRRELKKRNVKGLKVVYSREEPMDKFVSEGTRKVPQSMAFVPNVAGILIANEVIKHFIK